jgi:hypothetical protein
MVFKAKICSFSEREIVIEHSLEKAVDMLGSYSLLPEEAVFVLPTYTVTFACGKSW